jgi:hypothetical protein
VPYNPYNEEVYDLKDVEITDILSRVWCHSSIFTDKTATSFGKWCSKNKVNFTKITQKRKIDAERSRFRPLYVIKEEFTGKIKLLL